VRLPCFVDSDGYAGRLDLATQRLLGDGQLKRGKLCYEDELFVERFGPAPFGCRLTQKPVLP
jgi:hypothetical protein